MSKLKTYNQFINEGADITVIFEIVKTDGDPKGDMTFTIVTTEQENVAERMLYKENEKITSAKKTYSYFDKTTNLYLMQYTVSYQ